MSQRRMNLADKRAAPKVRVQVMVSRSAASCWRANADAAGLSLAAFVRQSVELRLARLAALTLGEEPPTDPMEEEIRT